MSLQPESSPGNPSCTAVRRMICQTGAVWQLWHHTVYTLHVADGVARLEGCNAFFCAHVCVHMQQPCHC